MLYFLAGYWVAGVVAFIFDKERGQVTLSDAVCLAVYGWIFTPLVWLDSCDFKDEHDVF